MRSWLQDYLPQRAPSRDELGWLLLPVMVAVALLAFDRFGVEHQFFALWADTFEQRQMSQDQLRFFAQIWLTAACLALMVLLPTVYLWLFPRSGGNLWSLSFRLSHLPVYVLLFAIMLPIVWVAATRESFMYFYPLYNPATLQLWLVFECFYLLQFFCVEYFFRGPLLMKLEQRFGLAAIGMMVVPYALIHIYKPFPEAVGSIIAGLALGYLAIRIRSIWPGVFLHCGVALAMDIFALVQSGRWAAL